MYHISSCLDNILNTLQNKKYTKQPKPEPKSVASKLCNDLTLFIDTWKEVTHKPILLTPSQEQQLDTLINKYSYEVVICAIQKIKESQYLTKNVNITCFIQFFEKIYNDIYKDRVSVQSNDFTVKKTRFNMINSRDWDWEELDRLEEKRLDLMIENIKQV